MLDGPLGASKHLSFDQKLVSALPMQCERLIQIQRKPLCFIGTRPDVREGGGSQILCDRQLVRLVQFELQLVT